MAHGRLMDGDQTFTAFLGQRRVAHGDIGAVATVAAEAGQQEPLLIFDDATGKPVDLDVRGGAKAAAADYLARMRTADAAPPLPRPGRGRPRLGVVAREVTLLPRHWDWLSRQPGGASATLRRLVEDARRSAASADRAREAQEALYRVMSALAGDAPGFEEASRALFASDDAGLDGIVAGWPTDVADYVMRLARAARSARDVG
jgi:hypothetical protein